jgi:hypothetical protein
MDLCRRNFLQFTGISALSAGGIRGLNAQNPPLIIEPRPRNLWVTGGLSAGVD